MADIRNRLADILDDAAMVTVKGLKEIQTALAEAAAELADMIAKAEKIQPITSAKGKKAA